MQYDRKKGKILMACSGIDFPVITAKGGKTYNMVFESIISQKCIIRFLIVRNVFVRVLFVLSMQSQCDIPRNTRAMSLCIDYFFDDVTLLSSVIAVAISLQMQKYSKSSIIHMSILRNSLRSFLNVPKQGLKAHHTLDMRLRTVCALRFSFV